MAKKKKNKHIMYMCNWHPKSYSEQARELVKARLRTWEKYGGIYDMSFSEVLANSCMSYRCGLVKYRMIKGLRRYGKRKGLI